MTLRRSDKIKIVKTIDELRKAIEACDKKNGGLMSDPPL